ncbi:MAG: hypothetical protein A3A29_00100 [Candidatus Ryanbacteria bacterium RIFCSPLOWO2_01_FULL_47_79]|uniref:Conserved hypothetical protein CHP02391 domain-containing protein n=2 Tax=Parcubacteria group TaxID=1794811 RepID=A0A1G2H425_9BACT|nr:MAG: hypothetical protein A3A29_00100 [Candidatus Ryanbacteria bacterium RIFCSPLOWO2_01_FULL_47_79]OGZ57060.1 MAG: hypothetical protein A3J04_01835 [Candidatus Ryanbacteria bacterium RIFCSPLOWO2_02_FULL_47_14]OHA29576.1 MAG: hypothetical protein A3F51_02175 [Candidatus Taylorbacteria bacterium RIFCSPHIGHO2_12_FULL_45_16]
MTKKRKKSKTIMRAKHFTPRQHQIIRDLADMAGKLIPATSRGDYSLQQLAKDRGLRQYFNERLPSKQKQFVSFITKLHGTRPRTLKLLINDILADAVEKRRIKGNPILRAEADALKSKLLEFGIDLTVEIDGLRLPIDRPKITPPPIVVQQSLERLGLNPLLHEKVLPLFNDGYVNEAVRKAGEIFESVVTKWGGVQGKYGRDLMAHVFNKDTPVIDVSAYHGSEITNPMDEKEGFMLVAMGSMHWCKNIVGHGDVDQLVPQDAAARIVLMSHLLDVTDHALKKNVMIGAY